MKQLVDLRSSLPWNPKGPHWAPRSLNSITHLVIHHSATGENADPIHTVRAFNRGHIRKGWPRIAYHYVISSDGTVYWTNRNRDICTHAGNWNVNQHSLGVCLIGRLDRDYPTPTQLSALIALREQISRNQGRDLPAVPHYHVTDTACPGRHWWEVESDHINKVRRNPMLLGVHLPNNGVILPHRWRQIVPFNLFTALVRLDNSTEEVNWQELHARISLEATIILRLYWPGYWEPEDVAEMAAERLPGITDTFGLDRCLIAIGNEPNHVSGKEGFGPLVPDAKRFKDWYIAARQGLRDAGYAGKLGFPALAPGGVHGEHLWKKHLFTEMETSGWVGAHSYWQIASHAFDRGFGESWRWYTENLLKPVYVTEFANSACDSDHIKNPTDTEQGQQYAQWCRNAAAGGVAGATPFILDGSPDWAGFRLSDYTLQTLAGLDLA